MKEPISSILQGQPTYYFRFASESRQKKKRERLGKITTGITSIKLEDSCEIKALLYHPNYEDIILFKGLVSVPGCFVPLACS
jgi:hypothetical protein